jgi:hypothetical protein
MGFLLYQRGIANRNCRDFPSRRNSRNPGKYHFRRDYFDLEDQEFSLFLNSRRAKLDVEYPTIAGLTLQQMGIGICAFFAFE